MDRTQLSTQLSADLADISWSDLEPHAKRDAIIIVDTALDIVEVGIAIASDQVDQVQHWIHEALIQKPSADQLTHWNSDPTQSFQALIVQPYVLISNKSDA